MASEQGPAGQMAPGDAVTGEAPIPAAVGAADAGLPPSSPAQGRIPRRRLWPVAVALLLVLAAGGWLGWRLLGGPRPLRVLVGVEIGGTWWGGSKPAALLADELADRLAALGFDPVRAGDPEVGAVMEGAESLREAARSLDAAFIVSGRITPERVELPELPEVVELRVQEASIEVSRSDEDEPLEQFAVSTFAAAPTTERAMRHLVGSLAVELLDGAVPAMMEHPSLRDVSAKGDPALLDRTAPAREYLAARRAALDRADAAYRKLDGELRQTAAPAGTLHILSPPEAEDRLAAVGPAGLLLTRAPVRPRYSPDAYEMVRQVALERVLWLSPSGKQGPLAWRGYNAFTSPASTAAGEPVVLVEDLWGRARTLVVIRAGAAPSRLRLETERKLSAPRLAPDGRTVALIDRACRTCPRAISVVDLGGEPGRELRRLDAADYQRVGDFGWLGARRLMVVADPTEGSAGLWAIEVASGQRELLVRTAEGASLSEPRATTDGAVRAAIRGNGVWVQAAGQEAQEHAVGTPLAGLALSPDGRRIAVAAHDGRRRSRIAVLELQSGRLVYATDAQHDARAPAWAMDGGRIYFELHHPDPVFGRRREVVRVAWVATP